MARSVSVDCTPVKWQRSPLSPFSAYLEMSHPYEVQGRKKILTKDISHIFLRIGWATTASAFAIMKLLVLFSFVAPLWGPFGEHLYERDPVLSCLASSSIWETWHKHCISRHHHSALDIVAAAYLWGIWHEYDLPMSKNIFWSEDQLGSGPWFNPARPLERFGIAYFIQSLLFYLGQRTMPLLFHFSNLTYTLYSGRG